MRQRESAPAERDDERRVADLRHELSCEEQAEVTLSQGVEHAQAWFGDGGHAAILSSVPDRIRVACVQLTSRADKAANLETADRLVAQGAATGADVVVLPEKWNAIGSTEVLHAAAEPLDSGESVAAMAGWARGHGITLVGGSITERREGRPKLSNTSLVFDPDGNIVATYRKIHLFDVEVAGVTYRESEAEEPGDSAVVAQAEDWTIGLSVCYDVRFPELYRILALEGAELVTVPAHFTTPTGKDHWHVLLRARAIENQCYVAAAAQVGETLPGKPAYGRSLIADPWGIVLAQAPDEETVIVAELDRARLRDVRAKLPSLANRQPDAYKWPALRM
jgi:predicted amidohydrolase